MKNTRYLKLLILCVLVMHFSCKKPKITSPVENVSFTINQKIAYTGLEEIQVVNNSVGTWSFEWYIDDQLVSENIILTKDKLLSRANNIKHELKLVGVNSGGLIKMCIDTFEYRDTINFHAVKFSNYASSFIKILLEDTAASFVGLDLRFPAAATPFVSHYPPSKNCLISYAWKLDSFKAYENKYFNPRAKDFPPIVNLSSIKTSYLKTDIKNSYILYGGKMRNDLSALLQGGILSTILDVKLDRKNNFILIKTSQLDIALRI